MSDDEKSGCQKSEIDDWQEADRARRRCEFKLGRMLSWVGTRVPDEVNVDGEALPLREVIWKLLSMKELSERDICNARRLVHLLEEKRFANELMIKSKSKRKREIEELCLETACLIRAILTLKGIETRERDKALQAKCELYEMEDIHSWLKYLRQLKEE